MAQRKFIIDGGFTTNADSDITGNLVMTGSVIPTIDSDGIVGYDLGSPTAKWRDLYLSSGSLYIDGQKVVESNAGTIVMQADPDQSLQVKTSGTGTLTLQSGTTINMASTLQMGVGQNITSADGNAVQFGDKIQMNGNRIVGVGAPVDPDDLVTKAHMDTQIQTVVTTELQGFAQNAIQETDSNVTVNDAGTGNVIITVDGATRATFTNSELLLTGNLTFNGNQQAASTAYVDTAVANVDVSAELAQVTSDYQAADSTLNTQLRAYADAGDAAVTSAAQIDAQTKANAAVVSANSYTDSKIALEHQHHLDSEAALQGQIDTVSGNLSTVTADLSTNYVGKSSAQALHATDALRFGGNILSLYKGNGTFETVDLSLFADDTNLARIVSGTMDGNGIATFTRDDATSFTVDMSILLDDTNLSRITTAGWNTTNGVLTLTRNDATTITVDLDGRFQPAGNYADAIHTHSSTDISNFTEAAQDVVGGMVTGNSETGVNVTYDDTAGKLNFSVNNPTITLAGDLSGAATMTGLSNVTITATVADDSHNHIISNVDGLQTALDGKAASVHTHASTSITDWAEAVQDTVGGMVSSNTESGIAVTYDDATGKLNFNVNDPVITLAGDVTGAATMTNLGNVTITTTIADDSHNHVITNVDGLQSALDAKQKKTVIQGTVPTGTDGDLWWDSEDGLLNVYYGGTWVDVTGASGGGASGAYLPLTGGTLTGPLIVEGDITTTGDVIVTSDIRSKENIEAIADAGAKVAALNGVTYTRKSDGGVSTGLIAQDVQAVLPEAVHEDEDGMLAVKYGNLVGLLVEAIKELQAEVKALKGE